MTEPTFDQIVNPNNDWEDDWDNENLKYTPKHAQKEKPNMIAKITRFLARTLFLMLMVVGILWIAGVISELLTQLIPF